MTIEVKSFLKNVKAYEAMVKCLIFHSNKQRHNHHRLRLLGSLNRKLIVKTKERSKAHYKATAYRLFVYITWNPGKL